MNHEEVRVVSVLTRPVAGGDTVVVSVAETLRKRRGMMNEIILAVLLPQLLLVGITLLHVWFSVKRGLQPLDDLTQWLDRRSARDLSPIPDADVPLEVRSLTHTINALMERLGQAMAAQRRFIENAAHQLRTPLAGLKLQAERAARATDLETMRPALAHIQNAANRVAHLSSQLLALAHSESSQRGGRELCACDLVAIAHVTCLEWVPRTLEHGVELAFDAPDEPILVMGDQTLLRELLNNLLDNALRYGGRAGPIVVAVGAGPSPTLSVTDAGPGLDPGHSEQVLERFYRVPGSPGDGCGLGLAIVKEICDLHLARLQILTGPGNRGVQVRVSFTLGAEPAARPAGHGRRRRRKTQPARSGQTAGGAPQDAGQRHDPGSEGVGIDPEMRSDGGQITQQDGGRPFQVSHEGVYALGLSHQGDASGGTDGQ